MSNRRIAAVPKPAGPPFEDAQITPPHKLMTNGLTANVRVEGTGPKPLFAGGSNFDLSLNPPNQSYPLTGSDALV